MAAGVRRADFKVDVWGQAHDLECNICREPVRSGAPVVCHADTEDPARDRHSMCLDCYADMHASSGGPVSCPECRAEISDISREVFERYRLVADEWDEMPIAEELLNQGPAREEWLQEWLLDREEWMPLFLGMAERNHFLILRQLIKLLGDRLGADVLGALLVKAFRRGHYLVARQLISSERFPHDFPRELLKRALASVESTRQHGWLVGALVNSPACAQVASPALKAAARHGLDEAIVYISRHAEARQHILLRHVLSALGRAKQAGKVKTIQVLMESFSDQAWRLPLLERLGELSEELPIQEVPAWALDGSLTKEILDQAIASGHGKLIRTLVAHSSFQSPFVIGRGILQSILYQRYELMGAVFQQLSASLSKRIWKAMQITAEGVRWALPILEWFPVIGPAIITGRMGLLMFRVTQADVGVSAVVALAMGIMIRGLTYRVAWRCAPALGRQITKGVHFAMPNLTLRLTELWHGQYYSGSHLHETGVWLAKFCVSAARYMLDQGVSRAYARFTRIMVQRRLRFILSRYPDLRHL